VPKPILVNNDQTLQDRTRGPGALLNRPLVYVTAAFVAGLYAAAARLCPGVSFPLFLFVLGCVLAILAPAHNLSRLASIVLCAFAVGALLWNARHTGLPGDPLSRYVASQPLGDGWAVTGRVRLADLEEAMPDNYRFLLDADEVRLGAETLPLRGGVSVQWSHAGEPVHARERVCVHGKLTTVLGRVNPGVGGVESYLRGRGIHTALHARGPDAVECVRTAPWWSLTYWASCLRLAQSRRLAQVMDKGTAPFVDAVWLGYRSGMSDDEYQAYVRSGTVHILSVSGLHMTMVFVTVSFLLRLVVRNPRWRAALVLIAVLLFTLMSGVRPGALRAALMITVYVAADLFDRERDVPTALSLSALILLACEPDSLFDTGFQLSFLCIASMLLFGESVRAPLGRLPRPLQGPLATALAVQVLPTPLVVHAYHVFPLMSIAANVLIVPLTTLALWLCFLTTVCTGISMRVALLFGYALDPVVSSIRAIADLVSTPRMTYLTLVSPSWPALIGYWATAACAAAALGMRERRRAWVAAAVMLGAFTVLFWNAGHREPTVVFLDVGHGDSTFVRTPDGTTLLVDAGDRSESHDAGKKIVAPFLWSNGVKRLDCVAVSHPDRDHIGGMFYIIEQFHVSQVLLGAVPTDRPLEQQLLALCAERGTAVRRIQLGDTLELGGAELVALHPPPLLPQTESVNNTSLVLYLKSGGTAILLPGDVEAAAEARLSRQPIPVDIVKAPHHGSRTSSSEEFIRAFHPNECIVSTGGASGGEPVDALVLTRYRRNNIRVWRTDYLGGIQLTFNNGEPRLQAERPRRGYPYPTVD
jgi:competence protein ComEC